MHHARGVTLIELLTTLAIAAVLTTIAVPSYQSFVMNSQLTAKRDALANALRYARSTALNQNTTTEVCPVSTVNSTTCGNTWPAGWMVILKPTGTASLLQSFQVPSSSLAQVYSETDSSITTAATSVNFNSRGLTTSASALFVICDSRGKSYGYTVAVESTGFIEAGNTQGIDVLTGSAISTGGTVCP